MNNKPFPATPVFGALLTPLRTMPVAIPGPDATPADRIATAIAYLTRKGSATDAEMREAIGLTEGKHLSVLGAAITAGRLHKDGKTWKLGASAIAQTPERRKESIGIEGRKELQPEALNGVGHAAPVIEPVPAKPPRCRFAVWSDGTVEIKASGLPSLELSRDEFEALVDFVERAA